MASALYKNRKDTRTFLRSGYLEKFTKLFFILVIVILPYYLLTPFSLQVDDGSPRSGILGNAPCLSGEERTPLLSQSLTYNRGKAESPAHSTDVLLPPPVSLSEIHEQIESPKSNSPFQLNKFSQLGRKCHHHSLHPNPMTRGIFFNFLHHSSYRCQNGQNKETLPEQDW